MGWRQTTLTILAGASQSEELNLTENYMRGPKIITFHIPATLTGVVKLHEAPAVGGTYGPLNDGFGNDVTLLPGKVQVQSGITSGALKLISDAAEAADRVFTLRGTAQP
jgi:hypothetical protein